MWDLLAVMRRNVYHAAFAGSYSLKAVLPAFLPKMAYDALEVSEGMAAGLAWAHFVDRTTPLVEKSRLKNALLESCKQDTLALAMLLDELRKSV
jgi:hypothetical protein